MKDKLHQPYRAPLIPGMERILSEADQYGALGVALSGAGPTIIAFADKEAGNSEQLESFMKDTLQAHGVSSATMRLDPSNEGVLVYRPGEEGYSLFDQIKGEVRA